MLQNYFKIALRNLRKQKLYAFINIFGLAVGIAFCVLIFLYVRDELTYDRFHEKTDRIFRVYKIDYEPDGSERGRNVSSPAVLGPALKADFPEVEQFVRFSGDRHFVRFGEKTFEEDVLYADPSIFEVFSFPLYQGNPATALADLNAVVLSQEMARKYFRTLDVVGEILEIRRSDRFEDFIVTGVVEQIPSNSSIQFGMLLPIANTMSSGWPKDCGWNCSWLNTYVELASGTSPELLEAKMPEFWRRYHPETVENMREEGIWSGDGIPQSFGLQPLAEQHLNPDIPGGLGTPNPPTYSYILAAIAFGVLLIACINFMTLAIGRSAGRSKEIGIRKVVGAGRAQLMRQFWGEAFFFSLLALLAGLALAEIFLPVFNGLTGKNLHLDYAGSWTILAALTGMLLMTGFVAGSYPALVLSGFRPVEVLKNRLRLSGSNTFTRALVVVQFGFVAFLIMGALTMLRQLDYMRTKDLGFNPEHVVVIPTRGVDGATVLRLFENELRSRSGILGITGVSTSFNRGYSTHGWVHDGVQRGAYVYDVASDYLEVLDLELIAGRNFNANLATDSTQAVIVNEAFAEYYEWPDPVGQVVEGFGDSPPVVIGQVKDFNFQSLHEEVEPAMLRLGGNVGQVLVRISPDNVSATLDVLRSTWQHVAPDVPFDYAFLDDDLNRFYENEQQWSRIIGYSAFMAILIACLGMFGLAAITAAGRTKEIGIRKVLGASVRSLTTLLSRDFVKLVLIAVVLATPAAYYATTRWLENFAYRIEIGPGIFLLAGAAALLIALATVSYQAVKAALADPVQSLRYE